MAKKQLSKQEEGQMVKAILDKNATRFQKFTSPKDAFNYFQSHFGDQFPEMYYDRFHYFLTSKFPNLKKKKSATPAPKKTATKAVVVNEHEENDDNSDLLIPEEVAPEDIELVVFDPSKEKINKEIFIPLQTGKGIDKMISKKEGFMPGTTIVIYGDAGTGKSTISFDCLFSVMKNYPNKECMSLSSEMSKVDLQAELEEKEWMKAVKHVLLESYKAEQYKAVIQKTILYGYEFLVVDSFQDIIEKLVAYAYMNKNEAVNWLLGLIKDANDGKTTTGHNTCVFLIQQVTKGGTFVGTNALKHNTTATMELCFDENGERYLSFLKNRRNGASVLRKLYYSLNEKSEVVYDMNRLQDEVEKENLLKQEKTKMNELRGEFSAIFKIGDHAVQEQEQ